MYTQKLAINSITTIITSTFNINFMKLTIVIKKKLLKNCLKGFIPGARRLKH